jgi:hypothetical protein
MAVSLGSDSVREVDLYRSFKHVEDSDLFPFTSAHPRRTLSETDLVGIHMNFTASARSRPESESLSVFGFHLLFRKFAEKSVMVPRDFEVPEDLEPQPTSNVAQAPPIPSERARET